MATWVNPLAEVIAEDDDPAPFDGWAVLLAAIEDRRPDWQLDAACRYAEGVTFFPERGEPTEPAKAVCARCPVDLLCELQALELDTEHGIWAGQSARKLKRSRAA
jgi:WhiB family redox-sensing transcriptional regulator